MVSPIRPLVVTALALALAGGALSTGASAGNVAQPTVVSPDPADFTPNVQADDRVPAPVVNALAQGRGTIYAGGRFRVVQSADLARTYERRNLMAFDAETGVLRRLAPKLNGTVWSIARYKKAIFVGGEFTRVNGKKRPAIVKLNAKTGKVKKRFKPSISSGAVTEVRVVGGKVVIGGSFPGRLRALTPGRGKNTGYIGLRISGSVASKAGPTSVYRFAVSPNGRRLVAVGNFTKVNGKARSRAFMLNLRPRSARLNRWYYEPLRSMCSSKKVPDYLRDVDFAPSGRYFVLVAAGFVPKPGGVGTDVCDATARFETAVRRPTAPTWINYTGGDTLHSVAATGAAVYVQGHQRWLDNPLGRDSAGPGAVSRPGIGAIDPATGKALDWNPGKSRAIGGKDMLATRAGLWVGSDGTMFGGEYRARIAFCPL